MRNVCLTLLVLVFSVDLMSGCWADDAKFTVQLVSFEVDAHKVVGTLTAPVSIRKPPIVVILHGMSGNRHGSRIIGSDKAAFQEMAETWARNGVASLRFSTRGRGGSEGDFLNMTLERRVQETIKAVEWIAEQDAFDLSKISLLGHSQGTYVAASAATKVPDSIAVNCVVLWAPQADALVAYRRAMGRDALRQGLNAKFGEVVQWRGAGGRVRSFRSGFFKSLSDFNTVADIRKFDGRVLVVTGRRDRWSPTWRARVFDGASENLTFMEFDVGHRMGADLGITEYREVSQATFDWIVDRH